MAAARYWRLVGFAAQEDVTLHTLQLLDGDTRSDGAAVLTCRHAPSAGALSNLQDEDAGTTCTFAKVDAVSAGFALMFDLGSSLSVTGVRLGAVTAATWPDEIAVESLVGGVWSRQFVLARLAYPGDGVAVNFGDGPGGLGGLVMSESFTSDIPAGFATAVTDSATLTATHDAAAQVALLNSTGYNSAWFFELPTAQQKLRVWLDVEWVNPKNGMDARGVGVYLRGGTYATSNVFFHDLGLAYFFRSPSETQVSNAQDLGSVSASLPTSGRHTYEVISVPSATAGARDYTMLLDGAPLASFTSSITSPSAMLRAGIFLRSVTVKLHEVRLYTTDSSGILNRRIATYRSPDLTAASAPVPDAEVRTSEGVLAKDMEFGGVGVLTVNTKLKGTPDTNTKAKVTIERLRDKAVARVGWSDPITGKAVFDGLDTANQQFVAIAEYPGNPQDPTLENYIRPVAGVSPLEIVS